MKYSKNSTTLAVIQGDITEFQGYAIVNPANTLLVMGGGVAGAIKKRAGEVVESEARKHAPVNIGKAIVTGAGKLKCKFIIHTPTVRYPGSPSSPEYVYKATRAALVKAKEIGIKSLAFPLMGAGVGGLKPEESIESMLRALHEAGEGLEVYLVIRDPETYRKVIEYLESSGWTKK